MSLEETERLATLEEMSLLFSGVQQMGQVLANQTHGASHRHARELNEFLYLARKKLDVILAESQIAAPLTAMDETAFTVRFTTRFGT